MKIENSVALVTGANRGLGLAFVNALLAGGARKVYAAARNPDAIVPPGATRTRLDVTNGEDIAAAARELSEVNLLINNAGIASAANLLSPEGLSAARAEMETNYFGPLALTTAFAPILARNGGGAVVNVLSVLSWISLSRSAGYSASKSAAWSLTNGLRILLRPQGTLVLGLHVGFMDTDMAKHAPGPKAAPDEVVGQVLAALEAGREEVLADDLSRNVKSGLAANPGIYLGAPGG